MAVDLGGEAPVASPCINICRMEAASGLCEGCLRTLDEIAAWSQLSDAAKRDVWVALEVRRAARAASPAEPTASPETSAASSSKAP
ncbi:MAG: DUF1289 domain-containing protein [Burkholderiales bacterium]|nr:DUF1289 domain-containing protein [Burkholderiales bacterium]